MVAGFHQRFTGDAGQDRVGVSREELPEAELIAIEEELTGDRLGKITVGKLAQEQVG